MRFDLWGSITCGQSLEPQGVNRELAPTLFSNYGFHQSGPILSERQGWTSHGKKIVVRRVVENDKGMWVAVVGAIKSAEPKCPRCRRHRAHPFGRLRAGSCEERKDAC